MPLETSPSRSEIPLRETAARDSSSRPTYAVVLKTYTWDPFIRRQAQRCAAAAPNGDFYVSLDETNRQFRRATAPYIVRTSQQAMFSLGLANRFEAGSLLWWNADYPHYHFFHQHPTYDYYVFIEYDALFTGDLDRLIQHLASVSTDFATFPLRMPTTDWPWSKPHLAVYSPEEIEGCLMCISALSRRALTMLYRRRIEMSAQKKLGFWPSAEAFLPTEIKRAGQTFLSLEGFGDTTRYDWRPPSLEEVALKADLPAFFHPVYDRRRYVRWTIEQGTLRTLSDPSKSALAPIAHLPKRTYLPIYANTAVGLFWKTMTHYLTR